VKIYLADQSKFKVPDEEALDKLDVGKLAIESLERQSSMTARFRDFARQCAYRPRSRDPSGPSSSRLRVTRGD
jgi:hypothetical protein